LPKLDRHWILAQFEELHKLPAESERLKGIDAILNRTNPGPGSFYDDLGNLAAQPHLEREIPYEQDPDYFQPAKMSSLAFGGGVYGKTASELLHPEGASAFLRYPSSWWSFAESFWSGSVAMHYRGLDPHTLYRLKVVCVTRGSRDAKVRLVANGTVEIHGYLRKPSPFGTLEFDIPREATASGELGLRWTGDPEAGGAGAGPMIAEVFLMRR
jgi:hypothetical protein